MAEPIVTPRRARRAKRLALAAVAGTGAALGIVVAAGGPLRLVRGAFFALRVASGRSKDLASDLAILGRTRVAWAPRILERHVASKDDGVRRAAMAALAHDFPESPTARACREYESNAGRAYFEGKHGRRAIGAYELKDEPGTVDARIARWETFVREHEDFPGRDDAGYRLARAYEEAGRPRDAFRTLAAALAWGDRDMDFAIRDRITNVLDAQCSQGDTRALLAEAAPAWRPLLTYTGAAKLIQAHRFDEALVGLDAFSKEYGGCDFEMLAHAPSYFRWRTSRGADDGCGVVAKVEELWADVARQRKTCAALARLEARRRAAARGASRAEALVALATRALEDPHAFENLVLHDRVRTNRFGGWNPEDDEGTTRPSWSYVSAERDLAFERYALARNHVVQAARWLERAVREDPDGPFAPGAARLAATTWAGLVRWRSWGEREGHDLDQALRAPERTALARRAAAAALAVSTRDPLELLATSAELRRARIRPSATKTGADQAAAARTPRAR